LVEVVESGSLFSAEVLLAGACVVAGLFDFADFFEEACLLFGFVEDGFAGVFGSAGVADSI